jgi:hypothetical protein
MIQIIVSIRECPNDILAIYYKTRPGDSNPTELEGEVTKRLCDTIAKDASAILGGKGEAFVMDFDAGAAGSKMVEDTLNKAKDGTLKIPRLENN